jgi:putative pyruvate formate lyase activating enzyme
VELGLEIPLVYNTGSYDSVDTLKLLEGIFDIYMPDMKYGDGAPSGLLSGVDDYATVSKAAVREMHRQVGDLTLDSRGIASRGLIIRHLVLPVNYAATGEVLAFVAGEISKNSYINLMDQFAPSYKAREYKTYPGLRRALTRGEFDGALRTAGAVGLTRLA